MREGGVLAGGVIAIAVAATSGVLPALFTGDDAVRHLAGRALLVVAALQPVNAVVFVLDGVLIGAGDSRYLAVAMVGAALVFVPAALGVAASGAGLLALWGAMGLWMGARLAGMGARYAGDQWLVTGAVRA
jgi:Na+-driven multidrug efflux pump